MDDILLNKAAIIERCLGRIADEIDADAEIKTNFTKQDSVILNLLRACEASIDGAMHLVRKLVLGVPQTSRDAFGMLAESDQLSPDLSQRLQAMVGFRNIAVHNYQQLNTDILESILESNLTDFEEFAAFLTKSASAD